MNIDKEFKSLIPPLQREELERLEANVVSDGCRDALVTWNGILIDGHNRYEICTRHDLKFKTKEMEFPDRAAVKLWIIDNQFGRRNLADIDRIALAMKREEIVRPLALENERKGKGPDGSGGRGKKKNPSAILPEGLDTRREAAKVAGVGERTYDAGKQILAAVANGKLKADDLEAIRRKEKSIHRVAKDLKDGEQKAKRDEQRKAAAAEVEPQFFDNVHIGDFRELADNVAKNSLSLIFTDPPYDRKSSVLYDGLGEFAKSKLADGGSLLCYVGHIQLLEAMQSLSKHLRFWWPCCCLHSGNQALMREYGIRVGWKPVLWFVKGVRHDTSGIVMDVVSGTREKTHHDWQQAQSEAEYWIENLCPKDGVVCDPFLGGGTTAAAAIAKKRRWVGFEKDHDTAVLAMRRCKS